MLLLAHRGASSVAPENTMAAFKKAKELNADGIELDVHLSKDRQLVVCHDERLTRVSDSIGYIRDMTVEELKKVDVGSWFSDEFKGEKIPTLEEVLDWAPDEMIINIEIKDIGKSNNVQVLKDLLSKYPNKKIIISSFEHAYINAMLEIDYKEEYEYAFLYLAISKFHNIIKNPGVSYIGVNYKLLNNDIIKLIKQLEYKVLVYTVNDREIYKKLEKRGIECIITDDIETVKGKKLV